MSFRRMMLATLGAYVQGLIDAFKARVLAFPGIFEAEACLKTQLDAVNDIGLLQDATIVITPNGVNEDILHTVKGNTITAPPYNLASFTESTTSWGLAQATFTTTSIANPFGVLTNVVSMTETVVSNSHRCNAPAFNVIFGKTYTASIYLKKGIGITAPDIMQLYFNTGFDITNYANFDIVSETVTDSLGVTTSITNIGSGWFRCSITMTATTSSVSGSFNIAFTNNNPLASRALSYIGAVTSNVSLFGLQIEENTLPTTYQPVIFTQLLQQGYAQHTRSTTGYRTESTGLVREVPQENLLAASENMLLSTVTKSLLTVVANTEPSPIANAIPMLLNDGTGVGRRRIANTTPQLISIGEEYMLSVYAKKAQHDWIQVSPVNNNYNVDDWANFNLDTGTIGNKGATGTAYIESIGNGWYRCSVLCRAVGNVTQQIDVCQSIGNVNGGRYPNLSGTNQNVFYICGNTFTRGNTVKPYYPTTLRTNTPRVDYTDGSCPTLLLEQASNNSCLRSEEFDNAVWVKSNITVATNTEIAPNGLLVADTLTATSNDAVIKINGSSQNTGNKIFSVYLKRKTGTGNISLIQSNVESVVTINNTDFTRCYVIGAIITSTYTATSGNYNVVTSVPHLFETGDSIRFNVSTGAGVATNTAIVTVVDATTFTFTNGSATASGTSIIYPNFARIKIATLGDEIYAWGGQIELVASTLQNGYYEPTSYIPTTTAAVTRATDVLNLYKIRDNNLLNNTFSLFWEVRKLGGGASQNYHISLADQPIPGGTTLNGVLISGLPLLIRRNDNGVALTSTTPYQPLSTNYYKGLITCNNGNFNVWIDGSLMYSFTMTNYDKLTLLSLTGEANGISRYKQVLGWNRVLNRAEIDLLFQYPYFNAGYTPVNNELQQIINRANAEGFTIPNATILGHCDTLITEMKNDGVWNVSDVYFNFAYNDVTLSDWARINWMNPYGGLYGLCTVFSGMTYRVDGYKGDGVNGYIDTNYFYNLASYNYTLNNAGRMFVVSEDATIANVSYEGNAVNLRNSIRKINNVDAARINADGNILGASFDMIGIGLKSVMRDNSVNVRVQNLATTLSTTQTSSTGNQGVQFIFRSGASTRSDDAKSNYWMGASLTNTQIQNFRTYYNTYLTNIGLTAFA